MILLKFRWPS